MDVRMSFIWPAMLVLLVLIPPFVVVYLRLQQRRRQLVAGYGNPGLVLGSGARRLGARRHIPAVFFLLALLILIVALARPQALVSLPRIEGTVLLAFDVSGSMAADDMKPSRMEAAKTAARAFVERQPATVQIGVVSFSDSGFAVQAPTNDPGPVVAAINRLAPQRGTSLARGIQASLNAIALGSSGPLTLANPRSTPAPTPPPVPKGSHTSAVIVLLTDGENTVQPDPLQAAQQAADRGIRIYTVGIGSTAGATLKLDGFTVRSRLDEATLQQIAQITGGAYYNAENENELQSIYDNLDPELVIKPQQTEVTALFAGAGILALLLGGTLSLLWLGRVP
jgi:Ca-activated chloride channel family protein